MPSIAELSAKHPLAPLANGKKYDYGTAGFRTTATLLDGVCFRVGLIAALRSRKLAGQTIGVMVTASHNPAVDNGVKIVDPMGEMLESDWEPYATSLVNATSDAALEEAYYALADKLKINPDGPARIVYGRDTRPSGESLCQALADAFTATNTPADDYKVVTTPQLHFMVRCINTTGTLRPYGEPTEKGYYTKLADAFKRALHGRKIQSPILVDCANGVGAPKTKEFIKYVDAEATGFQLEVVNDNISNADVLNLECGADFVKTKVRAPAHPHAEPGKRYCSFDGDADRLIYYRIDASSGFAMLDGDRIAALSASFFTDLVRSAGLTEHIRIGVVQTAYANGASTTYINHNLQLPVACTPTGVKHLHITAQKYDIGIYFESNGHGTVIFSTNALTVIKETQPQSPAQKEALEILAASTDLINQAVGDALSDMLMVEVILAHKGWNLDDWAVMYTDLPARLVRVDVGNKDVFKSVDAERKLEEPAGAQAEIDHEVSKYNMGRSFARASGTENAARVYAEAATRTEADELAAKVCQIVMRYGK